MSSVVTPPALQRSSTAPGRCCYRAWSTATFHIIKAEEMTECRNNGITTCMGMEEFPPAALVKLREAPRGGQSTGHV
jgi:hypothetical protein